MAARHPVTQTVASNAGLIHLVHDYHAGKGVNWSILYVFEG
jgi:hypothetical protein